MLLFRRLLEVVDVVVSSEFGDGVGHRSVSLIPHVAYSNDMRSSGVVRRQCHTAVHVCVQSVAVSELRLVGDYVVPLLGLR